MYRFKPDMHHSKHVPLRVNYVSFRGNVFQSRTFTLAFKSKSETGIIVIVSSTQASLLIVRFVSRIV